MNNESFRKELHQFADWIADYYENIENYPVKAQVKPGDIMAELTKTDSLAQADMPDIFADFERIIMPGITHWQSPNFFAYFPANASYPSILGEMLTAALGAQCMIWETSPAAAELEEYVMNLLRDMIGLPDSFSGVIQDTASTATLTSLLIARERTSRFGINKSGFDGTSYRVYCSSEAHSSIEKAVKIAGIGAENLVKIPVDNNFAMIAEELSNAIEADLSCGFVPIAVVSAFGTTGSTAIDPIRQVSEICKKFNLFHHIDAALAGTTLLLPEMRKLADGYDLCDSFVFNPHKWMFTNFDCSAYFVRNKSELIQTFEIMPEYLKTQSDSQVNNYRDWGIQLGRRFRALKLWFVIRNFGLLGLQSKIQEHLRLAQLFSELINNSDEFELLAPVPFNTICFRLKPNNDSEDINAKNERLLSKINSNGKLYITHTKLNGKYTLRLVIGQTSVEERHILEAYNQLRNTNYELQKKKSIS